MLSLPQPWATLLARGIARFVVRADATDYRGTIAIGANANVDMDAVDRMVADPEFASQLIAAGFSDASDIEALPRNAIVGVAVIADLWSLKSLEEVATEDDAILIGDVVDTTVFWELAEAVEISPLPIEIPSEVPIEEPSEEPSEDPSEDPIEEPIEESADTTAPVEPLSEPMPDALVTQVREATQRAGARFDDDGLVFWPVAPSASLAALIGEDAIGDPEITRRVWAYVVEQDLQDPEDHAYVYLDDALRSALDSDADGMPTIEFTDLIVSQMVRITVE